MRFKEWLDELDRICRMNDGFDRDEVIGPRDPRLKRYWCNGMEPGDAYNDFIEKPPEREDIEDVKYDLML